MSRPRPILVTRGRTSAHIEPATPAVRAAIKRVGCKSMFDPRLHALAIPVQYSAEVESAMHAAGLRVEVVLGLGAGR